MKEPIFGYRPVNDCFEITDKIRANHLLFEDFKKERTDVSKFVFYMWLEQNELKAKRGKDEKGNMGFGLKYIDR